MDWLQIKIVWPKSSCDLSRVQNYLITLFQLNNNPWNHAVNEIGKRKWNLIICFFIFRIVWALRVCANVVSWYSDHGKSQDDHHNENKEWLFSLWFKKITICTCCKVTTTDFGGHKGCIQLFDLKRDEVAESFSTSVIDFLQNLRRR